MKYAQAVIKSVFSIAFACFTLAIIVLELTGAVMNMGTGWFAANTSVSVMFGVPALLAGMAAQVFKITKIPAFSRHIAFFILIYATFIFVFLPLSPHTINPGTTLVFSGIFIVVYLIALGIYAGVKKAADSRRNKNLEYEEVYKGAKPK